MGMIRIYRDPHALPHRDLPPRHGDRYFMGLEHREIVASAVPIGGRLLEWGAGNTTSWFRANLPDAEVVTIEHDEEWAQRYGAEHHAANTGKPGTVGEEWWGSKPDPQGYISAARDQPPWDVIFVDGVLRNLCMLSALDCLTPTGVLFLHDAQRPWYEIGKSHYSRAMLSGSCYDYPGPELWAGFPCRLR